MLKDIQEMLSQVGVLIPLVASPDNAVGDYGIPLFTLAREQKKSPKSVFDTLSSELGVNPSLEGTHFVAGYMNFALNWQNVSIEYLQDPNVELPTIVGEPKKILLEYLSPNTNKAMHIGHLRNNTLGSFLKRILSLDASKKVTTACLLNDRGIHVCKSMLMYMKNPHAYDHIQKGDHKIGAYYAAYNEAETPELEAEARDLLLKWEAQDPSVMQTWYELRDMVLKGFAQTNARQGVSFDRVDFESDIFHKGKERVLEALKRGACHLNEKGQVAFDLSKVGMTGEKILLREDGTTFYLTQDIGVAADRAADLLDWDALYYVVGDEQAYHFETLAAIMPHMVEGFQKEIRHVSYGMVELPEGRMQSRAGRVILADDLMDALKDMALQKMSSDLPVDTANERAEIIGQAALKFYLLDSVSTSKIRFDMEQALDPTGRSGAYILYTYARLKGVISKVPVDSFEDMTLPLTPLVKNLLKMHFSWEDAIKQAVKGEESLPLTKHLYNLARMCNTIYNDSDHIVKNMCESDQKGMIRLFEKTALMMKITCNLLGFNVLEQM